MLCSYPGSGLLVFGMISSRFAQSHCSSAPVRLRYICFAGIGHRILEDFERRGRVPWSKISPAVGYWLLSVFVTPDLQLALPAHACFTQPLRKSFTALSLQLLTIGRIDTIDAKSAQLAKFQRSLIDAPGPMRNSWPLGWRTRSRSSWSIVPGILSDPQCAIDGSFT